jgi:hypothetical protein
MKGAGAIRRAGRLGLVAAVVSIVVLGGVAQPAPPALMESVHPTTNAPDPLGRVRCVVLSGRVVSGPCVMSGGQLIWRTPATRQEILQGIDQARTNESLAPLNLPAGFSAADPEAQTLALVDAERASRGLPMIAGRLPALNRLAADAAAAEEDPTLSQAQGAWGSVWGEGIDAADVWFAWMYRDGWAGSLAVTENIDCVTPTSSGCWGHRNVILGDYGPLPLVGIASVVLPNGQVSIAMIITAGTAPTAGTAGSAS